MARRLLCGAATIVATACAGAAMAQTTSAVPADAAATDGDDLVVTGSRIPREGYDVLQPTTTIGAARLEERAATNIADVLRELPALSPVGISPVGDQSGLAVGQNFLNFFGLGSQRTLTLVNGKRFPSANTPSIDGPANAGLQVDLNTIPVALIERVDTVAVGGAPIYGSDAIAGTVNIILKKRYVGFDATAQGGTTQRGDASRYRVQALYGVDFADGRGNVVVNAEYDRQDPLRAADRAQTARVALFLAPTDPASPYRNVIVPDQRVAITSFTGVPLSFRFFNIFGAGVRDGQGRLTQFSPSGDLVPFDPGVPTSDPVRRQGGDGLDLAQVSSLLAQTDRYYGNVFLNYDLAPGVRFHGEGWYSRTDGVETVNQPIYNGVAFTGAGDSDRRFVDGPFVVRLDNGFLTPQARAIVAANLDRNGDGAPDATLDLNGDGVPDTPGFYVDKGSRDLTGGTAARSRQELYRGLAGLEGDFTSGGHRFTWDVTYAYGRTEGTARGRVVLTDRLNQAVDAVAGANGVVTCRDPSNGCAPYDIFTNAPSAAAVAFIGADAVSRTRIEQHLVSANLAGQAFDLPAGPVGFALGVDYRHEASSFVPDPLQQSGRARGAPLAPVGGSFASREAYGEVRVPLVGPDNAVPLVHRLEVEGAARYVDNSRAGADWTWTAGGRYEPVAGLELRGNYTRSIRAPAVTELFLPTARTFTRADDPCDARFVTQGNAPATRAANCAAAGLAQPFSSLIVSASQPASVSGNPDLRNERADSYTFGAVLRPAFVPGFVASADWVDITLHDAIESLDATTVLQSCYDSGSYPTAEVCSRFTRNAQGQIASLVTGYANAGRVHFAGLTANASYAGAWGGTRIGVALNYQYTDKLQTSVTGSDFDEDAGEIGNSRHRGTANLTVARDAVRWFGQAQYIGKAVFDNSDAPGSRDPAGVGAWVVVNTSLGIDVAPSFTLTLAVDNLFDGAAPRDSTAALTTGAATYLSGLLGRTFSVAARARF